MLTRRPLWRLLATTILCGCTSLAASVSSSTHEFTNDPRFDGEWVGNSVVELDGKIAIQDGELQSVELHSPPITIEYRVRSDGRNARFSFGAEQVLFNWETNPTQLRIDSGPANGRHIHGKGSLRNDADVTITHVVLADRMDVYVDGESRGRWFADFSAVKEPIRVSTADWSTLIVRSIRVTPGELVPKSPAGPICLFGATNAATPPQAVAPFTAPGFVGRNANFDDDFVAVRGVNVDGDIVLRDGFLASLALHEAPIDITYRVVTDGELILGYGAWQLMFNWAPNLDQLRIDDGPAGGQHIAGKGRLPKGEMVTIRQIVRDDGMQLFVNDELRGDWKGDFCDYRAPIKVCSRSQVRVESIRVVSHK